MQLPALLLLSLFVLSETTKGDYMQEYKSLFEDTFEETLWEVTEYHTRILSLIEDPSYPGTFIVSTRSEQILHLDPTSSNVTALAGEYDRSGHRNGAGADSLFDIIYSLCYIPPLDKIILSDFGNRCLRSLQRESLITADYAGTCNLKGDVDGRRQDAVLSGVHTLLYDDDNHLLYMSERDIGKIKVLSLDTDSISTLITLDAVSLMGFTMSRGGIEGMTVIKDASVIQYANNSFQELLGAQSNSTNVLKRIVSLTSRHYLVTDLASDEIFLLDSLNQNRSTLCRKDSTGEDVDPILGCQLLSGPFDLVTLRGKLYIPSLSRKKILLRAVPLNCSFMEWTSWSSCESLAGLGVRRRFRSYGCSDIEQQKLCWPHPTDLGENEAYYIKVRGQCTLGEKMTDAGSRGRCAAHCKEDDSCEAFAFDRATSACSRASTISGNFEDCYMKSDT